VVKLEPTDSVPDFVSPDKTKQTVALRDFPSAVRKAFSDHFTPAMLEFTGCLRAWESPSGEELMELWQSVTPDEVSKAWDQLNGTKRLLEALVFSQFSFF
jgi:hypothetical protein